MVSAFGLASFSYSCSILAFILCAILESKLLYKTNQFTQKNNVTKPVAVHSKKATNLHSSTIQSNQIRFGITKTKLPPKNYKNMPKPSFKNFKGCEHN